MGVFRGDPPRSRWLPRLLMASLVLIGAVQGRPSGHPAVCGLSCCSVLPSCEDAYRVTCDCPELDKMTIRKGDVPATAREVTIRRPRHVIVEEDVIGGLPLLVNFTISDVGQLEIRRGVISSEIPTSLRWLNFFRIDSVKVEPMAFFDPREVEQIMIAFVHIRLLVIEANAFDIFLEKLVMQNATNASMRPEGFSKLVSTVELKIVFIDECHQGSLGQHSSHVMWTEVTIEEAKPGCTTFRDGATFVAQGLKLNKVKTKAFSGNPREVVIRDSQLGHLYENAFHLRLTKSTLRNVDVGTLHPFSLQISSKGPVYIDHVRIKEIKRDALRGIRLKSSVLAKLLLSHLDIYSAENSSLALSRTINDRNLDASYINVKSRPIPMCPNERYSRFLTGVGDTRPMTPAQSKISEALTGNIFCDSFEWEGSEDVERPMVETAQDTSVEPKDGHGTGTRPKSDHGLEEDVSAADNEDEDRPTKHVEEEKRPGHDVEDAIVSSNGADDRNGLQDRTNDDQRPTDDTIFDQGPTAGTKGKYGPRDDTKGEDMPVDGTKDDDVPVRDDDDSDGNGVVVGVVVGVAVLAVLLAVGFCIWKLKQQLKKRCSDYSSVPKGEKS